MMNKQTVETQAKIYMFDLNNFAREHGFKANEVWEINRATFEEKAALEKRYQQTVSAKVLPEVLGELFGLVKDKLIQAKALGESKTDANAVLDINQQYLVAFNPSKLKN
jgi:hypothetical protein